MTEKEVLLEITRISREAAILDEALERTRVFLVQEIGGALLLVRPNEPSRSFLSDNLISEFLESREFPFRGLYTVSLFAGSRDVGKLVACFGSWGSPGESLQRITAHTGKQFEALLARTREPLADSQVAA